MILMVLFMTACHGTHHAATPPVMHAIPADEIVKAVVNNAQGDTLRMVFNNTKHNAVIIFHKDTVLLQQDTTASGIHYSNTRFDYREWHGEIVFKKDARIVFHRP